MRWNRDYQYPATAGERLEPGGVITIRAARFGPAARGW
jgi:hypothetical protein